MDRGGDDDDDNGKDSDDNKDPLNGAGCANPVLSGSVQLNISLYHDVFACLCNMTAFCVCVSLFISS